MQMLADPVDLGFDPERLARIDTWMQRYVDEGKYAGSSVLVARKGYVAHTAIAGQRSVEDDLPFELDTIVRIYSMTKPITTVGLMMLMEEGQFNLDTPISAFLPEFSDCRALVPNATAIDQTEPAATPTIHQLLTHTSGLTYGFNPGLLSVAYAENQMDFAPGKLGLAEKVQKVAGMPLAFQPGTRWEYSVAIDILGRLIEVLTGQTLESFFNERILGPLAMDDTSFGISDDKLGRFASCYSLASDNPLHLMDPAATSAFRTDRVKTFSGGGGLLSTLADYFRFAEMLRCGGALDDIRLLSPRTVSFMTRNHLDGDISSMGPKSFAEMPMDGMGFGLGGAVVLNPARTRMLGSEGDFGWGGMASTYFWIDPVTQLTVVFFTQLVPSSSYPNRAELKSLVHGALLGD